MGVSHRILAVSVAALSVGGALTAARPAGAVTPPYERPLSPALGALDHRAAEVTDIREILNKRSTQVSIYKGEDKTSIAVAANGRWAGSMWVPWVGNDGEMGKSIRISWGGTARYWVFQDYWNTSDLVRYSTTNSYQNSVPVPGSNTGGGRKSLTVQSDGTLALTNTG
ncbi:hypothetical protein [Nonomuraea sp. NPDC050786]|uniref:hypothetical protein n=1 Tax=Nonomuraea sp. NPDC050786 TaxID=3154840 RepID=UPI003400C689